MVHFHEEQIRRPASRKLSSLCYCCDLMFQYERDNDTPVRSLSKPIVFDRENFKIITYPLLLHDTQKDNLRQKGTQILERIPSMGDYLLTSMDWKHIEALCFKIVLWFHVCEQLTTQQSTIFRLSRLRILKASNSTLPIPKHYA